MKVAKAGVKRARSEDQASEILAGCHGRGIEATATELARRGALDAVIAAGGDGTVRMRSPLTFRTRPHALRVLALEVA